MEDNGKEYTFTCKSVEFEPIKQEIKKERVYLIAGRLNRSPSTLFWIDKDEIQIGDYAIVENSNGYDLVKVIGRIETTKKEASKFSNTKYEDMKKTVLEVKKELIEKQ